MTESVELLGCGDLVKVICAWADELSQDMIFDGDLGIVVATGRYTDEWSSCVDVLIRDDVHSMNPDYLTLIQERTYFDD